MKFLTLLSALTLIHYLPQAKTDRLKQLVLPFVHMLERNFNDGKNRHGVIAWLLGALLPALVTGLIYYFLLQIHDVFGFLFGIAILYLTLCFTRFGENARQIAEALQVKDIDLAQQLLTNWTGVDSSQFSGADIARLSIETELKRAHHGLFAPIFWFVLLGPGGAVLYRLSHLIKLEWHPLEDSVFNKFALDVFGWLDWLPARFTAACFAIVGDFEDAIYCWRTQSQNWTNKTEGLMLASGAGALGVKLGEPLPHIDGPQYRPELGLGDEADADYLQSVTGLIWRVLILIVGLLCLLTFASWLGS
jgi:adenosylcobinamide-phosphate synthase